VQPVVRATLCRSVARMVECHLQPLAEAPPNPPAPSLMSDPLPFRAPTLAPLPSTASPGTLTSGKECAPLVRPAFTATPSGMGAPR
jgi:hypothetical protein